MLFSCSVTTSSSKCQKASESVCISGFSLKLGDLAVTSCGGWNHIPQIMNGSGQNLVVETPNLAINAMSSLMPMREAPQLGALASARLHWPEYLMEAALLGAFMVSACLFGALYESPHSPVKHAIASQVLRRMLMGLSMGLTAIAIIYSPWGKQSGAH